MPDRDEVLKALQELPEHEVAMIVRQMALDPRVKRREGARGWWYRYAGSVAFLAMILITALGFWRIGAVADDAQHAADKATRTAHRVALFSVDLRDGLIKNCEQNANPLRIAVAGQLQTQLQQTTIRTFERFFPTVPISTLRHQLEKSRKQIKDELQQIKPVDCQDLYPK